MYPTTLLWGVALVAVLVLVPGRCVARAGGLSRDGFTTTVLGVAVVSGVGLLLAWGRVFSLTTLAVTLGGVSVAGAVLARRRRRQDVGAGAAPAARRVAGAMALVALAWCWPPFETVLAGSDSTMYLNAGVHLAQRGSLVVESTAVDILGPRTAAGVFPGVRVDGRGPFIRLPGGLLMSSPTDDEAQPAFFPLLPVWAGVAALAWGPEGAPFVAPLTVALAVWAVSLFAAEALGAALGVVVGTLLVANFSFWWFGRFLMPEPLTCALVWGALVLLRRGSCTAAGALLGLAGLVRAETMLFVVAAVGLWVIWERPAVPVSRLLLGFLPPALATGFSLLVLPSHHLSYLRNDVAMLAGRTAAGVPLGTTAVVVAVLVAVAALGGAAVALRRGGLGERIVRLSTVLGIGGVLLAYVLVGGNADPLRSVRWLAAYCSWPLLGLALPGVLVVWRRGDPALRLALLLSALAALVFVINPRVAPFHPWAIRRFLPLVIPGLTVAAAAAVGLLAFGGAQRARRVAVVMVVLGLVLLEVHPVQAIRHRRYFFEGFRSVATLAEMLPLDAFVVVDSALADAQLQVPLWLIHGRETVMMAPAALNWRAAVFALADARRPGYWIDARVGQLPEVPGLRFERVVPDPELTLRLPNSPPSRPPELMIGRRYALKVYRVVRAAAP